MGKTDSTIEIENSLFKHFFIKRSMRCGLEVTCPKAKTKVKGHVYYWWNGRCDFVASDGKDFTFIEIKVSKSDFKSKNGHNLVGDKNYYAIPLELLEKVIDVVPDDVGIYTCSEGKLTLQRRCKRIKEPLYKKAQGEYGKTQEEMMRHNIVTACNSRIYGYMTGKYKGGIKNEIYNN